MDKNIWIVGAGEMAKQYAKVLSAQEKVFIVVGRGDASAEAFEKDTGIKVIRGGVKNYVERVGIPDYVIITVYPASLSEVSNYLIDAGVKHLLIEKPGGMTQREISTIAKKAIKANAKAYIAYNRRFYSSTLQAKRMIEEDGGVTSFNFEFTEWEHVISQYDIPKSELEGWFMANSTHVVDLAFFLGGIPKSICSFKEGKLEWHPIASRYSGAGRTEDGALFSYKANWASAGRWSIEVLTDKRKYIFEPLETLKIQQKGSIKIEPYNLNDMLDKDFKPGLYLQTSAFLEGNDKNLLSVEEQAQMANIYKIMETNGSYTSNNRWKNIEKMGAC